MQSYSVIPFKQVRSFDLLNGSRDSPQEHCHQSRRTLMTPEQRKAAPCAPNQLEMSPDSPALTPEPSPFPIQHDRWLDFLQATPEMPREHCPKSRGTPTSAQQLEECSVYPKSSRDES
uniref:Uncharacterized protein n=1 Tax=Rangifer tarandus platyrhynchus TaxID=3082113 RepID=A0ACB0E2U6_RANTA|nr:unnamed protein product [Rangifer tarandus platyrhynchus]